MFHVKPQSRVSGVRSASAVPRAPFRLLTAREAPQSSRAQCPCAPSLRLVLA
jgi:hypothetical protein